MTFSDRPYHLPSHSFLAQQWCQVLISSKHKIQGGYWKLRERSNCLLKFFWKMFSIPLVLDYFLFSMPTIYRFGLYRVLVVSWNSHQFLVTILSLSLLDGTTPSTLPWNAVIDLPLIQPIAVRSFFSPFPFSFFLFLKKLALLCFLFLILQIIFFQYFSLSLILSTAFLVFIQLFVSLNLFINIFCLGSHLIYSHWMPWL